MTIIKTELKKKNLFKDPEKHPKTKARKEFKLENTHAHPHTKL